MEEPVLKLKLTVIRRGYTIIPSVTRNAGRSNTYA
jgi:hypothetical protein